MLNIISVKNFDAHDPPVYNIKNNHALFRFQFDVLMSRTIASLRLGLRVKGRTEVVTTTATVDDFQFRYLLREVRVAFSSEQAIQFASEFR